jgi:hypothetical protein
MVIDFVRGVSEQERAAIGDAVSLFGEFGPAWNWNQVRSASDDLLGYVRAASGAFAKAKMVNAAHVRQVDLALRSLAGKVRDWLVAVAPLERDTSASPGGAGLGERVAAIRDSPPITVLLRLAELDPSVNLVDLSVANAPNKTLLPLASDEAKRSIGVDAS